MISLECVDAYVMWTRPQLKTEPECAALQKTAVKKIPVSRMVLL